MFVFSIDLSEIANYNSSIQFATGDYKQMKGLSTLQSIEKERLKMILKQLNIIDVTNQYQALRKEIRQKIRDYS